MPTVLDLTGQTFSRLTVIRRALPTEGRGLWICRCQCGKETKASAGKLRYRHVRSCGCLQRDLHHIPATRNLTGERFGRLVVADLVGKSRAKNGENMWRCVCDCGHEIISRISHLTSGNTKSCGCLAVDKAAETARLNFSDRIQRIRRPPGTSAAYAVMDVYQRSAKRRKLSFALSVERFMGLTQQECHYCGIPPSSVYRSLRLNGTYTYNGIDRVDSKVGYVDGNVVSSCGQCNRAKRTLSVSEFYAWIDRVHHWKDRELAVLSA